MKKTCQGAARRVRRRDLRPCSSSKDLDAGRRGREEGITIHLPTSSSSVQLMGLRAASASARRAADRGRCVDLGRIGSPYEL